MQFATWVACDFAVDILGIKGIKRFDLKTIRKHMFSIKKK